MLHRTDLYNAKATLDNFQCFLLAVFIKISNISFHPNWGKRSPSIFDTCLANFDLFCNKCWWNNTCHAHGYFMCIDCIQLKANCFFVILVYEHDQQTSATTASNWSTGPSWWGCFSQRRMRKLGSACSSRCFGCIFGTFWGSGSFWKMRFFNVGTSRLQHLHMKAPKLTWTQLVPLRTWHIPHHPSYSKKIEDEGVQGMHEIFESMPTSIFHFILYTVVKRQVSLSNMAGTSRSEGREKILKCCGSAFWPHYWFWHELTMCSSGLSPNLSWKQLKFGATWCISLQQRHRKI